MMKKFFVTMCAVLLSMSAFAGNPLSVENSKVNLKDFLKKDAVACLVIDWKGAKYDNKKAVEEELGSDYDFVKKDCAEMFIEGFNDKSKGLKLQGDESGAAYRFEIKVTNLDTFVNVMGFGARTEAKMWGTLKIVDAASGDTLAEIKIDEAEDGTDYVRREAYGKTFLLLGARIAKMK